MRRALLALAVLAVPAPAAAAQRPVTVPALQEWRASGGSFELRRDARVVVRDPALLGEARLLAADLREVLHRPVAARRARRTRPGDVLLARGAPDLGREGYALRVGRAFTVIAPGDAGLFYGGRTLLQLVRGGDPIPRGRGTDRPALAERGLMLDTGRAFFSRAWLERRIEQLADLKLNLLHLHFSDNEGFRVRSERHPEVVTEPALSKDDLRAIVAAAARRHITVVPELDAPGHLTAALRAHPELQLTDRLGRRQPDKLDVTKPEARRFVFDLIDELAPLFPGPWWHTGADEYLGIFSTPADYELYPQLEAYADERHGEHANGKDAVLDFVNAVGERVRAHGKELRVWSDGVGGGSAVRTDPRATVMWWEEQHSPSPAELVAAGHRVLNAGWWPTYYVTGGPMRLVRTPVDEMYEHWRAHEFTGPYTPRWFTGPGAPPTARLAPGDPALLGTSLQVWNDQPPGPDAGEAAVARGISPRLAVLAHRAWGSPDLTPSYQRFAALAAKAGA